MKSKKILDPQHKFVFICGLHRSGSSVLHELLRAQESISGFVNTGVPKDEGQHLQTVYLPALSFGGPGKFGFNPDAAMTETHELATEQHREKLFYEWSKYWDLSKPMLIEKSPPNIIRTRFLQAMFPNSSFVVIVRHPIAVSYATMKWSKSSLSQLFAHWINVHEIFERDRPHLAKLCLVSYEQLVNHTAVTLDYIGRFLSIPLVHSSSFSDHNEDYFTKWTSGGIGNSLHRRRMIYRFERQLTHFGYSLRDTARYPEFT